MTCVGLRVVLPMVANRILCRPTGGLREARYTSRSDFGGEEFAFALDAPAIAGEAAILADDAVAGDGDGDGVGADGGGDGAGGGGPAEFAGDLGVAAGFAAWDLLQRLPDALLEGGGADVEREGGGEGCSVVWLATKATASASQPVLPLAETSWAWSKRWRRSAMSSASSRPKAMAQTPAGVAATSMRPSGLGGGGVADDQAGAALAHGARGHAEGVGAGLVEAAGGAEAGVVDGVGDALGGGAMRSMRAGFGGAARGGGRP